MMLQKLRLTAAALALASSSILFAQDKPAPQPAAEAPKAAPIDVDKALAGIPEVIATYGKDSKIMGKEVKDLIAPQLKAMLAQGMQIAPNQIMDIVYEAANSILEQALLTNEAKAKGFKPDMAKAQERIDTIKKQSGEEQFNKQIASMNLTEKDVLVKIADSGMIMELINSLSKVDEAEAKKFYDKNPQFFTSMSASHILAKFPDVEEGKTLSDADKAKAMEKLKIAQKALADGKAFADIAKEHSDCPSKEQGGDLGKFQSGQMVPQFEEALKKLKPGEVSGPVETQFGYHLIKAGETTVAPYEEVKNQILDVLSRQNGQKVAVELIEKLKKDNNAKILIPEPKQEAPQK